MAGDSFSLWQWLAIGVTLAAAILADYLNPQQPPRGGRR